MKSIDKAHQLTAYLAEKGLLSPGETPKITYMSGGVSGIVALAETEKGLLLVKQALAKLNVKADWECDVRRIEVEHDALTLYAGIVPACVPKPVMYDQENCIMVREAAPASCDTWKSELLRGVIRPQIADAAIDSLAQVHQYTAVHREAYGRFRDQTFFDDLRLKPYILHLLGKYPELTEPAREQVRMLRESPVALIHGDYSPKNIMVDGDRIYIVDMEVACYSHPAFDLAFFMNHFFLKSIHLPDHRDDFLALVRRMMDRYLHIAAYLPPEEIEGAAVKLLGFMLLARVDGKSPAEYIVSEEEKERVRRLGMAVLRNSLRTFDAVIQEAKDEKEGL